MNLNINKYIFFFSLFFALVSQSFAKERFIQTGIEYDSNVYKNFGKGQDDFLWRARFSADSKWVDTSSFSSLFHYQQGVKKFFQENSQDQLLQSLSLFNQKKIGAFRFELTPSFKILIERNKKDSDNLDINENYVLPAVYFKVAHQKKQWLSSLQTGVSQFKFYANDNFSYLSEWMKLDFMKQGKWFNAGMSYTFSLEQFSDINRNDNNHDLSVYAVYPFKPNLRVSYTFSDSNSSIKAFSFVKHQLGMSAFYDLGEKDSGIPVATFYVKGLLQWSQFPSVFDFDEEGQRFLLTESEGQTFNSFVAKVSYHFSQSLHAELKYTRFSNDLKSEQRDYTRSIAYIGMKYHF